MKNTPGLIESLNDIEKAIQEHDNQVIFEMGMDLDNRLMSNTDGGHLVPLHIKVKRKGVIAWFYRLLKNEKGWKSINPQEEIMRRVRDLKIRKTNRTNML